MILYVVNSSYMAYFYGFRFNGIADIFSTNESNDQRSAIAKHLYGGKRITEIRVIIADCVQIVAML